MASTPADSTPANPNTERDAPDVTGIPSALPPLNDPGAAHPRIVEEHHTTGPYGEDEIEATDELGRRWYHLRPEPRRRYDFVGFNYTWWLIWVFVIFVIFLPWGRGWGY